MAAAPYADIFNYINSTMPYDQVTAFGNGTLSIDPKYAGIVNLVTDTTGGDDPRSEQRIDIDYSKLPNGGMTKFGKIGQGAMPAMPPGTPVGPGQQSTVKDRNLAVYDPNYGWITPASNEKQTTLDKVNSILPYIAFGAASLGFGSLLTAAGAPGLVSLLTGKLPQVGSFANTIGNLINRPSVPVVAGGTGTVGPQSARNQLIRTILGR